MAKEWEFGGISEQERITRERWAKGENVPASNGYFSPDGVFHDYEDMLLDGLIEDMKEIEAEQQKQKRRQ